MIILGSDIIANRYGVDDTFGNNSWATIKAVCQAGAIPATWAVGDTKTFVGTDGNTYTIRLSDKQAGRYSYANSALTTHAAFELLEVPTQTLQWNPSNTNAGGYADSLIRKNINNYTGATATTKIIDLLPDDLKNVLEEVLVSSSTGGSTYTGQTTSANKLFLLARGEVTNTSSTPRYQDETVNNGVAFGRYDYYATHDNDDSRIKRTIGTTTGAYWWLRSPYTDSTLNVSIVYNSGSIFYYGASNSYGASLGFAW